MLIILEIGQICTCQWTLQVCEYFSNICKLENYFLTLQSV